MVKIDELLEEIQSLTEGVQWKISLDHVLQILHLNKEDYYKRLYSSRNNLSGSIIPADEFDPNNINDLVCFLEACGYNNAESQFYRAGYYFSETRLNDWTEFFISVCMSKLKSHIIDRDLIETAIAGSMNFKDAANYYCDAAIDRDELIEFACNCYLNRYEIGFHHLSKYTLTDFIKRHLKSRIIRWEDIDGVLYDDLFEKAVKWGFIKGEAKNSRKIKINKKIKEALRALNFNNGNPDTDELKTRYRDLMKKFHPDINPEGLEKTRRINQAYALLLREIV